MTIKYVDIENLHEDSFVGEVADSELKIKHKIDPSQDNMLRLTPNGLKVTPIFEPPMIYTVGFTNLVKGDTSAVRRRLFVQKNGFGYLHLDFTATRWFSEESPALIAQLGASQPAPISLVEAQVIGEGYVYITENSRDVIAKGIRKDQRIVVDLVGYWRV